MLGITCSINFLTPALSSVSAFLRSSSSTPPDTFSVTIRPTVELVQVLGIERPVILHPISCTSSFVADVGVNSQPMPGWDVIRMKTARGNPAYATGYPEGLLVSLQNTWSPSKSRLGTGGDTGPGLFALSAKHEPVLTRGHERVVENGDSSISIVFRRWRVELWRYHECDRFLRGVWWSRGSRDISWTMK